MSTKNIDDKPVTLTAYVRFHLMERLGSENYLHRAGKLYQQWITDEWARAEKQRLDFIRRNQLKLRANLYKCVRESTEDRNVESSGRMVVLPASYCGSDRWYHRGYKNAMALVQKYGKPTFFLTQTFDVNCPEVKAELKPGQSPYDRPDLLCRIFNLKRKALLDDITKRGIFGECIAYVSVVEFQKRGAPHSHNLIWIKDFEMTSQNIDNVISAEIPPPGDEGSDDRVFHDLVVKQMIHGPCGRHGNMRLGCVQEDGTCKRKYPWEFTPNTVIGEDNFPHYRRRSPEEGGNVAKKYVRGKGLIEIDNRLVVPYSPYLLKKYGCHINMEYCHTVVSVKYLFLYHFKGEVMVTVVEDRHKDGEIETYITRRYMCACQAYWRTAEFVTIEIKPSVLQLPLHLPEEQTVTYEATQSGARDALARNAKTMMSEYFEANKCPERGAAARLLKYEDFTDSFVWNAKDKRWNERQRGTQIGRMVSIHPGNGDIFYLRLLLKNKVGATSFQDLQTVDGEELPTFKAACVALELCEDDKQWYETMEEAVQISVPSVIRDLFCSILLNCQPTDPPGLLKEFSAAMSEDYARKRSEILNLTTEEIQSIVYNDLLIALNKLFEPHGNSNASFDIEMPDKDMAVNAIVDDTEYDPSAQDFFVENIELQIGNKEQSKIFNRVKRSVDSEVGDLI